MKMIDLTLMDKVENQECNGCWEDYLTPDEHLDVLDMKLYQQSQTFVYHPWRNVMNY